MKQRNRKLEQGVAHLFAILLFVGLVGVVGFVGYNAWQRNSSDAGTKEKQAVAEAKAKVKKLEKQLDAQQDKLARLNAKLESDKAAAYNAWIAKRAGYPAYQKWQDAENALDKANKDKASKKNKAKKQEARDAAKANWDNVREKIPEYRAWQDVRQPITNMEQKIANTKQELASARAAVTQAEKTRDEVAKNEKVIGQCKNKGGTWFAGKGCFKKTSRTGNDLTAAKCSSWGGKFSTSPISANAAENGGKPTKTCSNYWQAI